MTVTTAFATLFEPVCCFSNSQFKFLLLVPSSVSKVDLAELENVSEKSINSIRNHVPEFLLQLLERIFSM